MRLLLTALTMWVLFGPSPVGAQVGTEADADEFPQPQVGGAAPAEPVAVVPPLVDSADESSPEDARTQEAQGPDGQTESVEDPPSPRTVVLLPVVGLGVDDLVPPIVQVEVADVIRDMGYAITESPPVAIRTAADLWRVTWAGQGSRGVSVRVSTARDQYLVEVIVVSLDGTGPFFGRGQAAPDGLRAEVRRVLAETLPPPGIWFTRSIPPVQPIQARHELGNPTERSLSRRDREAPRWGATLATEAGFGSSPSFFYNHFVGLRLDYRFFRDFWVGVGVHYANLHAYQGRADNFLLMGHIEDRVRLSSRFDLQLPLRIGVGYIPNNGAVLRFSAGLRYPIAPRVELGVDLLAPTIYFLGSQVVTAFHLGLEATARF